MTPISFPGSTEIKKPANMTDDECMSVWAKYGFGKLWQIVQSNGIATIPDVAAGIDTEQYPYYTTAWKPSYEDLQALNRGEPVYIKTLSKQLPPMSVFTVDENGNCNDPRIKNDKGYLHKGIKTVGSNSYPERVYYYTPSTIK